MVPVAAVAEIVAGSAMLVMSVAIDDVLPANVNFVPSVMMAAVVSCTTAELS